MSSIKNTQPAFSIVEDYSDFLVINKSPGIGFHDDGDIPGICTIVQEALGYPVFSVHRLDKDTSGLLILPKSAEIAKVLTEEFAGRRVQKYYLALSGSKPAKKQGWVIGDMVKSRGGNWKLIREATNPAVSYFFCKGLVPGVRCFLLRLYSGKTHQARVALKSLGAPILGDRRYGKAVASLPQGLRDLDEGHCPEKSEADRMYLHAYAVRFTCQGREYSIVLPPTQGALFGVEEMQPLLKAWSAPWELSWPSRR
ncbi:pseudouridine synthase [Hahella ganghwensis]|uniref:pseudouridine synthase n=1 Tax=Hahella ganghwensis TaxID=286420 RepID=UPI00037F8E8C|nr:pseudouridine synthase [Hahella ganghwensis]